MPAIFAVARTESGGKSAENEISIAGEMDLANAKKKKELEGSDSLGLGLLWFSAGVISRVLKHLVKNKDTFSAKKTRFYGLLDRGSVQ